MNSRERLLPLSLLIIAALAILPGPVGIGHGQLVGLVCLSPSSSADCPATPVTISSPVGTQMSVYVIVQGSDEFNGFDITLIANHTIIRPAGASLSGSILSGATVFSECIGGVAVVGPGCISTDTVDTVEFAVAASFLTYAPTTGLLFTALFNVTGTTTTPISFQTGCITSSVSGTTSCVALTDGSISNPPEIVQTASYTAAPVPTFTIGPERTPASIFIGKGESGNVSLILESLNGFSGTVSLSVVLTPNVQHPPAISLSASSVTLTNGDFAIVVLTASARNSTTKTVYTATVTGVSGAQSGSVQIELVVVANG